MYSRYRGTYITQKRGQITMKSVNIQRQESFCQRLKLKAQKQAVVKSSLDAKELKTGTWIVLRTTMYIAALFAVAERWKWPKCPSTDGQINKMWNIYTVNTMQPYKGRTFWRRLLHGWTVKTRKVKSISRKRTASVWFHLHEVQRTVKFTETESGMVVARGWWEEEEQVSVEWVQSSSWRNWKIFEDGRNERW